VGGGDFVEGGAVDEFVHAAAAVEERAVCVDVEVDEVLGGRGGRGGGGGGGGSDVGDGGRGHGGKEKSEE